MTRATLALVVSLGVGGCAVGPNFQPPAAPTEAGYYPGALPVRTASSGGLAGGAQFFRPGADLTGQWWTLFHSEPLNRLIDDALRANPDLAAAQAALRAANENVYAQQGAMFPTAGVSFQPERARISGAAFGQPGLTETLSLVTASVNVSYAPDVFGGTRRQIESLAAQADDQRFQLEATYLTLTSNLVVAAVQEASLRGQIQATRDIIQLETQQLDVVQRQFELGGAAKSDVLSQQATLTATQATLPPLQKQLAQTRDQLAALLGRFPNQQPAAQFQLTSLRLPTDLPVSLPSQLVAQRPDIRAAEAALHAASANVGVAIANQLPQFTLTGEFGSMALGFSSLFTPATTIWSMAGGVAATVFDGGVLLHKKRAAVAAFEEAAAQYRSTVLAAFQNVADALHALQSDADALAAQVTAEQSAAATLDLARRQFALGAISYPTLLNAETSYEQARINLVQAEATRFADTAGLFQALGGGWWHRTDVTAATKGSPDRFWLQSAVTKN